MSKLQKALDYNKLKQKHKQHKELKKQLSFPLLASIKYDGNYITTQDNVFTTSGGLTYTHTDDGGVIFKDKHGVFLAERIYGKGLLGDRNKCNLRGSKTAQTSTGHTYKVFDHLTSEEYEAGKATTSYIERRKRLVKYINDSDFIAKEYHVENLEQLETLLTNVVKEGYEGLILRDPYGYWRHHKTSRTIDVCKYKKRPTVDLLCIDVVEGTGKYAGLIGSLTLQDKAGRIVNVGSGMSDDDRYRNPDYFIGRVVEVFYEQIVDTYIQPTFGDEYEGVLIRPDKTRDDID